MILIEPKAAKKSMIARTPMPKMVWVLNVMVQSIWTKASKLFQTVTKVTKMPKTTWMM